MVRFRPPAPFFSIIISWAGCRPELHGGCTYFLKDLPEEGKRAWPQLGMDKHRSFDVRLNHDSYEGSASEGHPR